MNITSISNEPYVPVKTIVFYTQDTEGSHNVYSEVSNIEDGIPTSFRPLTKDEFKDIAKIISPETFKLKETLKQKRKRKLEKYHFSKMISRQILSFKNDDKKFSLCWCLPAHENNFILRNVKGRLFYPNLIFKVEGKSLFMFAYKGNLTENSVIFKMPFPNFYDKGNMCFGNMNVNKLLDTKDLSLIIERIEDAIFNSSFNALESKNRTKSNTYELLKRLTNSGDKFPTTELVKQPKTRLKNVIS